MTAPLLRLGVGSGALPGASSQEPFNLGIVYSQTAEPFGVLGPLIISDTEEPFWLLGVVGVGTAEPFALGQNIGINSEETFNILSADHGGFLGVGSPASPLLGWRDRTNN
jgi:hypothetical protein